VRRLQPVYYRPPGLAMWCSSPGGRHFFALVWEELRLGDKEYCGKWGGVMAEQGSGVNWSALADEVFSGMAEWRVQHPRARFAEIEREVDVRLAGLRARLLQETALRSRQADLGGLPATERPCCAACGVVLQARGKQVRRLRTNHDQEVALERSYAVCPRCGSGVFPPG